MVSKQEQDYRQLAEEAAAAFHAGDRRLSADKYLEAFFNAPSDWAQNRYHNLHGYTSILREKYFEPSKEDFLSLEKISNAKYEPHVYRSEALWTLGLLKWESGKRQLCADLYRDAIRLIDTAKPKERKKSIMASLGNAPFPALHKVEVVLQDNRTVIEGNLKGMENQTPIEKSWSHNLRSDGSHFELVRFTPLFPPDRLDLQERLKVGGDKCDSCGKTLVELGLPKLQICAKCKLTYYCSPECQRTAWRAGHKKVCRKKHEIVVGDTMQLFGLQSKPQLNGQLVDILGPDPKAEGRWQTKPVILPQESGDGTMSIAVDKLRHIRPVA